MRSAPPTDAELRATFNDIFDRIVAGKLHMCPTGYGFDDNVTAKLNALGLSQVKTAVLQMEARTALAQQITGQSTEEANDYLARLAESVEP